MSNPYSLLRGVMPCIPNECIGHILSFHRPKHPLSESIKTNFKRCGKCKDVVQTYDGQIVLRYYTIERGCSSCGRIGHLRCKYCPADYLCDCGSDNGSLYSWFSF